MKNQPHDVQSGQNPATAKIAVEDDDAGAPPAQAYENSFPGTPGNIPGSRMPVDDTGISRTMEQTAQTDSERGSPGLTPEEMRAMKR